MIIGLHGAKQSGKNTAAKIIAKNFNETHRVKEWSFAEDLKKSALASLFGKVPSNWEERSDKLKLTGHITVFDEDGEITLTGREFLQWYGTEAHRDIFSDDFWVENLMKKIQWKYSDGLAYEEKLDLITDIRFENEAIAILQADGIIIKISRPEVENSGDLHPSEIPLNNDFIDLTILNAGTLETFENNVKEAVNSALLLKGI